MGMVGLDVKAIRTQPAEIATKHLRNSIRVFLRLVELSRSLDRQAVDELIAARDYEELDWLILRHLMGQ
jgi:xylose isomerase